MCRFRKYEVLKEVGVLKIIKIFVASSINTFSKERKRIAAYFCDLNNMLIENGVFCDVKFCEELDNAVPESRKQEEYNMYISNSDLVLFLVERDCGEYTFEEFNIALCSKKNPHIVVFSQNTTNDVTEKVLFMKQKASDGDALFIPFDEYCQMEAKIKELVSESIEKIDLSTLRLEKDRLRKVSFFLGISSVENEDEKNEILRFVLGLNEKLLSKQIYVQIVPCTEKTDSEAMFDTQMMHEHLINSSDVTFFVFFSRIDKISEKDLLFAVTQFREYGLPKIYTYFWDKSEDDNSVLRVKKYIDQTLNHYYSIFSSVDSIKLSILLCLVEKNIFSLSVENSTIISHEVALLDVNELSIFSENETLNQSKHRLAELTNQYNAAVTEFVNNHNRRDLIRILSDLDDAIGELREKIRKEENDTLSMLYEMHRNVAKGEMNELTKRAYHLLEKGMIEQAAKILNKEIVDSYYGDRLAEQLKVLKSDLDDAIQMYLHTIHIQKMLDESEDTVNIIIACYETIMKYITVTNSNTYAIVLEYAQYLDQQNNPKAEQIFAKAEYMLANPEQKVNLEILAQLYSSMGEYYLKQFNMELSEHYLKNAYKTIKSLYEQNSEKYSLMYADACLNYARIGTKEKKDIFECGLTVMEQLFDTADSRDTNARVTNLAKYYYDIAGCYRTIGDSSKELLAYKKAAELLEMHYIQSGLLADVYNNIAEVLRTNDDRKVSKQPVGLYQDKALKILERLYATEPDVYAEALGDVYNNKCMYFLEYENNYYQGLQCLKACESVYLYWYRKNPRKNGQGLAECYIQMMFVYDSLGNKKRALRYAKMGVELLEVLLEINYDRYAIKLAWAYSEIGLLYSLYEQDDIARDYLSKSLDILEKSDSIYIKYRQGEIIRKMLSVISLMTERDKTNSNELVYDMLDRVFRFMYGYIKPSFNENNLELIRMLYSLGERLLYHFDQLNHEETMQFYYPAVKELGELRLLDCSISEDEKMFINFTLAVISGLSGDVEKVKSYFKAHLESFQKTDDYIKAKRNEKKNDTKKRKKKGK